jgi:signal transduction histidine kinase
VNGRRRSGIVAAVIAIVAGGALLMGDVLVAPTLQTALGSAASTGGIALAAIAGTRYTRERDPHALFVAVAGAVIGIQGIFAIWTGTRDTTASVTAWLFGWAVTGVLALFAMPWRDRRGRPPVRPGVVVGVTALAVIMADVTIAVALEAGRVETRADTAAGGAGPVAAAFGIIALATLAVAGLRELRSSTAAAQHVDLGVAWTVGVLVPLAQLQRATFGGDLARWADAVPVLVLAIAAGGFLGAERTEATRMRRASDRAEEVLGGRAEIASMIAHEVRGPVSTIKGLAATTSGSYDKLSDDERKEFVGLIQDEASRLLDVVDQTSLALRIDAGTLTFERRPHELAAVARDAIGAATLANHEVTAELDEALMATVDRRWLTLAVRQGVDNAARFSPPGAPIDVALRRRGNTAVIEVADRGPGVPAERRDEVFTRFARWRPPGYEDRQGSGLGLFICRGILAEHAGDASLDARPEGGTMLRLTIPLDEPPPMEV